MAKEEGTSKAGLVKPKCAKHGVETIRTRFFREPGDKVGYLADPHCPECNRESFGKHFTEASE